jgi:capsular exopolysaccharide synthesis family protein
MPSQIKMTELPGSDRSDYSPVPAFYASIPVPSENEQEEVAVPLSHYLWVLRRHLWKMLAFVLTCVLGAFVVSARMKPIYESTATIDVDPQAPSGVVGEDAAHSGEYFDSNEIDQFLATQIRLIQSDAVLRPVAEQYNLINGGEEKAQNHKTEQSAVDAPVSLAGLKVTRPPNTSLLLISYRSKDARIAADVANAVANSYLFHTYDLRIHSAAGLSLFMEKQIDELKAKMEQSGLALAQFQKDLDVVNPDEKTNILSARLLQLNNDYTVAQADRVRSEAAWSAIKSGSLGAIESSPQGESLAKLTDSLNQAKQRFALVKATYGTSHPEYRKAASELAEVEKQYDDTRHGIANKVEAQYKESLSREQMLQATVAETKAEWDKLNQKSFEYQRLKQEADTDKALYDELNKKIQEANINAGFQNNNVRIADLARPPLGPVAPNIKLNLLMAFLFSSLLAVGTTLLLDSLDTSLRDPAEAGRFLGADVIATIPADRSASQLPRPASTLATIAKPQANLLGPDKAIRKGYDSGFEESVRTLRNTILLSDFENRLHSIMLTSAAQGEGKSTLAAHLAVAYADRGKKVLLVDSDLRRPSLHSKFNINSKLGLSDVLTGEHSWREAIVGIDEVQNLGVLPAGLGSHRAADLIGPRLSTLLDEFAKEYDLVILDSPPLLGFAECLQIAKAADGVLVVSCAGKTKRRAVAEVVGILRRLRANLVGVVLNQMTHDLAPNGYGYYGYQGKYGSEYGHATKS